MKLNVCFPALAGKQEDLPAPGHIPQHFHGGFHTLVIEAHQHIIQHQRGLGGQFLGLYQVVVHSLSRAIP